MGQASHFCCYSSRNTPASVEHGSATSTTSFHTEPLATTLARSLHLTTTAPTNPTFRRSANHYHLGQWSAHQHALSDHQQQLQQQQSSTTGLALSTRRIIELPHPRHMYAEQHPHRNERRAWTADQERQMDWRVLWLQRREPLRLRGGLPMCRAGVRARQGTCARGPRRTFRVFV